MSIAPELLDLIPDTDPAYLAQYDQCRREGMHPAVAAVQADRDLHYIEVNRGARNAHQHRKDAA